MPQESEEKGSKPPANLAMKITIEVPEHHIKFFSDLASILESDWQTLYKDYIEALEFGNVAFKANIAFEAMEYAESHEEAERIADRAISFLNQIGVKPIRKDTLLLTYELESGEIDEEEYELLRKAGRILDGTLKPQEIPPVENADDDCEGEEWKQT